MTTSAHALTGAAIATAVRQPYLAIPLAFCSHFVCDAIPHFGLDMKFGSKTMYRWLVIDGTMAVLFAGILIALGVRDPVMLAFAGFAAMSPDLAWLAYGLRGQLHHKNKLGPISRFHSRIQWYQKPRGLLVEFGWAAAMIAIILALQ